MSPYGVCPSGTAECIMKELEGSSGLIIGSSKGMCMYRIHECALLPSSLTAKDSETFAYSHPLIITITERGGTI